MKLHIDFETASTVNLKRVGAAAYAAWPETCILCMAWAFDQQPPQIWLPKMIFPQSIVSHVAAGGVVSGWSLQFEFHIWPLVQKYRLVPPLKPEQLDDTQARAAYYGLPLSLEEAGEVLTLAVQKDKQGHALMLRMSRPREVHPALRWWHEEDPQKYADLCKYCGQDVEAERGMDNELPPLPPQERQVWLEDFKANIRGISVDRPLVGKLQAVANAAKRDLDAEMRNTTFGLVPATTNAGRLLAYINQTAGVTLPDLKKETVKQALALDLFPDIHHALELRQAAAKTSAAKLPVLLDASANDSRIRGLLAYYGAQRTGRWAGRLVQPQNLPRGVIKDHEVEQAIAVVNAGGTPSDLEFLFGKPALDIVIALIRSCLIANYGRRLVVADFSQIEARVIAWLAGQTDILQVFDSGEDVYAYTANKLGSSSRQLGKVLVLACGFGQGHVKFQETARGYGLELALNECLDAVNAWRQANHKIVNLWGRYDWAVKQIAGGDTGPVKAGRCVFTRAGGSLTMMQITLPSGRDLFYHDIGLDNGDIVYWGVHQTTKQWAQIRTYGGKLAENITQAVARDIMVDTILDLPPGLDLLLTIHDELICECDLAFAPLLIGDLVARMKVTPGWASGLPVGAAGWIGHRYKKG